MLQDNDWIIEYDMILAQMLIVQKLVVEPAAVTPAFLFDNGYACWLEMYPGEKADIKDERDSIIKLIKDDQKKYLEAIGNWNIDRVEKLKSQGWRRAQTA